MRAGVGVKINLKHMFIINIGIFLCGFEGGVSQKFLNGA